MSDSTGHDELLKKRCTPCEGGTPALPRAEAERLARSLPGWALAGDAKRISRSWTVKNFMAGIDFFNKVAALAEDEGHHPDLHLEGYRNAEHRDLDARRRRPDRERLHPGREDRPDSGHAEEVNEVSPPEMGRAVCRSAVADRGDSTCLADSSQRRSCIPLAGELTSPATPARGARARATEMLPGPMV